MKQFHFISWPDHGVPLRASPIIAFRRKVRSYDEQYGSEVMVVHCRCVLVHTRLELADSSLSVLVTCLQVSGFVKLNFEALRVKCCDVKENNLLEKNKRSMCSDTCAVQTLQLPQEFQCSAIAKIMK